MRTYLLSILTLLILAACTKEDRVQYQENAVTKKLELHIHAAQDYTDAPFKDVAAAVTVQILKINSLNGQSQQLWDTTIASRALAAYPVLPQKVIIEKAYPVLESHEKLRMAYHVQYITPAGLLQNKATKECLTGEKSAFLDVAV